MSIERDDPEGLRRSRESVEADRLCRRIGGAVGPTLIESYGIPSVVVYTILQEVFDSYMIFRQSVADPEIWLARQILAKANAYMKTRGMEPPPRSPAPHLLDTMRIEAAMKRLPPGPRRALLLMFHEQMSREEIAEELGVTHFHAGKLVTRAIKLLRKWIAEQEQE